MITALRDFVFAAVLLGLMIVVMGLCWPYLLSASDGRDDAADKRECTGGPDV